MNNLLLLKLTQRFNGTNIPIITVDFWNQANIDFCQTTYQATSYTMLGLIFPTYLDPIKNIAYFKTDKNLIILYIYQDQDKIILMLKL